MYLRERERVLVGPLSAIERTLTISRPSKPPLPHPCCLFLPLSRGAQLSEVGFDKLIISFSASTVFGGKKEEEKKRRLRKYKERRILLDNILFQRLLKRCLSFSIAIFAEI